MMRVRRLTGPGARAAASRWAAEVGAQAEVELGSLPTGGERLWLDDAPGSRGIADTWAFWAELEGLDVELVLTGRAVDGAHPEVGHHEEVAGPGEVVCPPCQVRFASLRDPGDLLQASPLLALAQQEALEDADPVVGGLWSWIELRRLRCTNRDDERTDRTLDLRGRGVCRARALLELARSTQHADLTEALQLAELARELAVGPTLQDARFVVAWLRRAASLPHDSPVPHSVSLRVNHKMQVGEPLDPAGPPEEQALLAEREGRPDACARWVACGELVSAARVVARTRSPEHPLHLRYGGFAEAVHAILPLQRALEEDPSRVTSAMLRRAEPHLEKSDEGWLLAGRAAVCLGDVAAVVRWADRLARLLAGNPERRLHHLPELDGSTAVWPALHWLERVAQPWMQAEICRRLEALAPRPLVVGSYALRVRTGGGGAGDVWVAEHVPTGRRVAAKVLREVGPRASRAFAREIDLAAGLEHPAIVAVLDRAEVGRLEAHHARGRLQAGQQVLVMEMLEGGSLSEQLGELEWTACAAILERLLGALSYIHARGLVHRDVKPGNVLLDEQGRAFLVDFGLADAFSGSVAGTPLYMAPEQFLGRAGPPADLYGLGCLVWALLCGAPPFLGDLAALRRAHQLETPGRFEPLVPVPPQVESWLRACLDKDPARRPRATDPLPVWATPVGDRVAWTRSETHEAVTLSLDLWDEPAVGPERPQEGPTLPEVPPARRPSGRRPLPTTRLLRDGDPAPLWCEEVRDQLWQALRRVQVEGAEVVALTGEEGTGRHILIRDLVLRAGLAGVSVSTEPAADRLCVVEGPVDVPAGARWLVLQSAGPRPLRLHPAGVLRTSWWLRTRFAVSPAAAAEVSVASLGRPGRALSLLESWSTERGLHTVDGRLAFAGPAEQARMRRRCRTWWPEREGDLLALLAVHEHPLDVHRLESLLGRPVEPQELAGVARPLFGAWHPHEGLLALVREELGPARRHVLHRRLHRDSTGAERAFHALHLVQSATELLDLVDELVTNHPRHLLQAKVLARVRRQLQLHLVQHPVIERVGQIADLSSARAMQVVDSGDPVDAAWAVGTALFGGRALRSWDVPRLEALAVDPANGRHQRDWLLAAIYLAEQGRGSPTARRLMDQLDVSPWARALGDPALQAELAESPDPQIRRAALISLSAQKLESNLDEEALALLGRAHGLGGLQAAANRVVALLRTGRYGQAASEAREAAPFASERPALYGDLTAVALLGELERPPPIFAELLEVVPCRVDPRMQDLLRAGVAEVPASRERDLYAAWLSGRR